ncbi:hypothetical protein BG005_006828 [Podila minutissima]|nr:hypothetical protein BG005_006828 [Podila minutissima]
MKIHSLGGLLCKSSALALVRLACAFDPVHDKASDLASIGSDSDSPIFAIPASHLDPLDAAQLPPVYALGRNDGQHLVNAGNNEPIAASPVSEDGKDDEEESEEDVRYMDKDDEDEDNNEESGDQDANENEEEEDGESDTIGDSDANAHNPAWDGDFARRIALLKGYHLSLDSKRPNIINTWINNQDHVPVRHDVWPDRVLDPCAVVSHYGSRPIPYETVKACLDSDFPFPSNHRAETAATVKSLIANFYVYEDLATNPPSGDQRLSFLPVDIQRDVDQLLQVSDSSIKAAISAEDGEDDAERDDQERKTFPVNSQALQVLVAGFSDILDKPDKANIAATSKMTDRAFHDGLSRILAKARDGHLSYDADCFRAFRWQQGFFMSHVARDSKVVLKVHSVTPSLAEATGLQQDLLNCDVVSIEGQDAAEYIQQWADAQVSVSKDANVRFNAALASPQYRPGFVDFFIPGKFGERYSLPPESSLEYTFKCPGQLPIKTSVKWLGLYTRVQSKPFHDIKSYFAANCMSPEGLSYDQDEVNTGRSKIEQNDIKDEEWTILQLRSRLRDMLSHSNTETEVPSDIPADSLPNAPQDAPVDHSKPETPMPEDTPKLQSVEEIFTQLDMLTNEKLPIVKFYDDFGGRPSELSQSSSGATFKELFKGAHDIAAILLADGETGVITVRTESSIIHGESFYKVHPAWVGALIQAINVLRPVAKNLILDLTHNTGGYICLGVTMTQLFFPDCPRLVTNIKLTPLSTQMMAAGALGIDHLVRSYGEQIVPAYKHENFLHTIQHPSRNVTFTDFLSDRCAIADQYVLSVDPALEARRHRASSSNKKVNGTKADDEDTEYYRPWDPENMAIMTEGYCGSSCALISNMMHTKYGVPTVVIGGQAPAEQDMPMAYSTFPGLQVIDDAYIFSEMNDVRSQMMSAQELERLERGGHTNKDRSAMKGQGVLSQPHNTIKDDSDDDEEDEDDDMESFYPHHFSHKSRLRLTWRQMYNTGPNIEAFRLPPGASSGKDVSFMYEPMWKEVDQWYEYGFLPASYRIDYTDQNIHSIGAIWEDTRDAVWGSPEGSNKDEEKD